MKELLKKRRRVRLYTLEPRALVQRLPKVDGIEVAKSVGGPFDRDIISIMTYGYSSFFVIGGNGKVWYFNRKPESNSYTWTDKLEPKVLEAVKAAHGAPEPTVPTLARQVGPAEDAPVASSRSLSRKLTEGIKSVLERVTSTLTSSRAR
ncbi:uncharacterized protein UDID_14480 [Ustilago sp. UG-2017a]|nr:uncharacterized protein UDID_14480 [Ustilago sp. UG-2017a]